MNAKEIGRSAGRIFAYQMPSNWILRPQEDQEDYGIDAEIEIATSGDNATGLIFKAQIKGQLKASKIKKNKFISFDLSVERLSYYIDQINIPVILFVVDITNEVVYWDNLKINSKTISDLRQAIKSNQKSVAVHLKSESTFKGNYEHLLKSVNKSFGQMRVNALNKISSDIKKILPSSQESEIESILRKAKLISFEAYNEQFERLLYSNDYKKLYEKADLIYKSTTELIETKFCAAAYIEKVILTDSIEELEKEQLVVNLYISMLILTRRQAEKHLRTYAILLIRSFYLKKLINTDYHSAITRKIVKNDPLVSWIAKNQFTQSEWRVAEFASKTVSKLNSCLHAGFIEMFAEIFSRVIVPLTIYSKRLKEDGLTSNYQSLERWMIFCIELLFEYGKKNNDDYILSKCVSFFTTIYADDDLKKIELNKSFEITKLIKNEYIRKNSISFLEKLKKNYLEGNIALPEQEIKFFKDRAISLGIDVNNPKDEIGQIINQGLLDYNPERIIKDCEHMLYIPSASLGIHARMVAIPSAGMKYLYCLKGKGAMSGWSLDNIYSFGNSNFGFKESFCKDCIHKKPRDESWKWNSKWQNQISIEHNKIFEKFNNL